MTVLRRIENGQRKALLLSFLRLVRADVVVAGLPMDFDAAWGLVLDAEAIDPAVVDEIIMFPAVGLRLRRAVERVVDGFVDSPANRAEIGVLHVIAAAAAIRTGVDFSTEVPVVRGVVTLPTVGTFTVSVGDSTAFVRLTRTGSRLELGLDGDVLAVRGDGTFHEIREHRAEAAGAVLDVVFDDWDPHRVFVDSPSTPDPLTDVEFKEWSGQLDRAWSVILDWNPGYATELSNGLLSLVPLRREGLVAASSSAAFGAIALSEKSSADELAEALVHELQHSKLNAVFEAVTLHDAGDQRFFAPWRDSPRPLDGVLHGVYAFTSVVEFWCARRGQVSEGLAARAEFAFVLRALQVRSAIEEIRATAPLNEWGTLFLETLSRRLAVCEAELAPEDRSGPVAKIVHDRRALWRVEHLRADPADIAALVDAWTTTGGAPADLAVRTTVDHDLNCAFSDRVPLLEAQALRQVPNTEGVDEADLAYARGDLDEAAVSYRRRVVADADDEQAWVGLALTLGSDLLFREPEVVLALHREVSARTGTRPDPVRLVEWLAAGRS
ncbi:aKG-HExxH-type peptide beta-hydroxylase [Umezawaea sp. NPDC059074]|uniref:aKG-HExxH-type peptide beta-hydroxylase n=1 Tax=Umezawaea sp. NPDC059074 TaxID=3346716 RepID=UPI00369D8704